MHRLKYSYRNALPTFLPTYLPTYPYLTTPTYPHLTTTIHSMHEVSSEFHVQEVISTLLTYKST